jgi:hypothetical protein
MGSSRSRKKRKLANIKKPEARNEGKGQECLQGTCLRNWVEEMPFPKTKEEMI